MGQILTYPLTSKLMQRHGNEHMRVGVSEMQGYRVNMEDQHTVRLNLSAKHPNLSFFSVFDGHAGDRASIYLSEQLHERVGALENPTDHTQLTDAMLKLDADFLQRKEERSHGSTSVFAVVERLGGSAAGAAAAATADGKDAKTESSARQWRITVGNIGDSRAVLIRKNGDCISLTEDHKPNAPAEAERIRAAGGFVSSNRVDGQLAMSRAIGDWSYKGDASLPVTKQKVIAVPEFSVRTADEGDMLLLCCDGIVEQMTNEAASAFLTSESATPALKADPAQLVARLLEHALKSGSKDNMTAMVIQFGEDGRPYDNPKHEYIPGPYYQENRDFVDAFKTDARRHGLEGAALDAFIQKAQALPKPEPVRNGPGAGGMNALASMLRAGAGAGPGGDDEDDEDGGLPMGLGGGGMGGGMPGNQREQLRQLMELLQKGAGPAGMMDTEGDEEDEDEPPKRGGGGAGGAGAGPKGDAPPAVPGKNAKKNAKKRAKKKGKTSGAASPDKATGAGAAGGAAKP